MIYRRRTYKIDPGMVDVFNQFFHEYLFPNQLKHGAKLVGRWVNETRDEIVAIWEYQSYEEYQKIENLVRNDELHLKAQEKRKEIGPLFDETHQDFLTSTGSYYPPKHVISAFGYITNEHQEVLMVRTYFRSETWSMPGGQVEEGESLDEAAKREIEEETGIQVELSGITGVYTNVALDRVNIGFRGTAVGGKLRTSEETMEVRFQKIDSGNMTELFSSPHTLSRVKDAMSGSLIPYENYKIRPYELIKRYGKQE